MAECNEVLCLTPHPELGMSSCHQHLLPIWPTAIQNSDVSSIPDVGIHGLTDYEKWPIISNQRGKSQYSCCVGCYRKTGSRIIMSLQAPQWYIRYLCIISIPALHITHNNNLGSPSVASNPDYPLHKTRQPDDRTNKPSGQDTLLQRPTHLS